MEIITLSGNVAGKCEKRMDKNGNYYLRFMVFCEGKDYRGNPQRTFYRCVTYDSSIVLKEGDMVFLTGDLKLSTKTDEKGKAWFNCDIYVKNITKAI